MAAHIYEVRTRRDKRGFDLLSDALPFGRFWYNDADAAISYAKFYSRSQSAEVRVFDAAGAVVMVESWTGNFKEA
jgi:spore maturation protein CgeB